MSRSTLNETSKISVLMPNLAGRGGHSQHCYCLCNALASRVNLTYLVPRKYESADMPHACRVESSIEQVYDKKSSWRKGISHLRNLATIYTALKKHNADIYHFHDVKIPAIEMRLLDKLHRRGIPVVYTAHNVLHHEKQRHSRTLGQFYRQTDAIIVHAVANKEELVAKFALNIDKIHTIPMGSYSASYGIPHGKLHDNKGIKVKLGFATGELVILFFGYIRDYKGLDILLEAMRSLQNKHQKVKLLIVGEPVGSFEQYQKLIDSLPYPQYIYTVLRYVSTGEATEYLMASDVVVMPYRRIYQSGVIPLAYAHGRPVIATKVGGLPEVIDDTKSGFLVDPEQPELLADAIAKYIQNPDLAKRQGEYAHKLSISESAWDWQDIAEQTVKVYKKVLQTRTG